MPTDLPDRAPPDAPLPNERHLRKSGSMELDPSAEGVAVEETRRLIASDKVEGTAVYDPQGERLGSIHNFMVDKVSGQVAYAVIAVGGFLGLGEAYHPLPWRALTYNVALGGYVVTVDRDALEGAPRTPPEAESFADPAFEDVRAARGGR